MARNMKQPDIRRRELLEIGLKLFLSGGSKAVSIREVVRQANVANGLFYYYFKTKEVFIDEVLTYYVNGFVSKLEVILTDQNISANLKLEKIIAYYVNRYFEANDIIDDAAANSPQHIVIEGLASEKLITAVTTFLIDGTQDGIFSVNEPDITARFIVGGMSAILRKPMLADKESTYQQLLCLIKLHLY